MFYSSGPNLFLGHAPFFELPYSLCYSKPKSARPVYAPPLGHTAIVGTFPLFDAWLM